MSTLPVLFLRLSDPGRWDERRSPRSRSWSHNGYSDLSSAKYVGHSKRHRKEKKAKHRKKAKKQKHLKRHKQAKKKRLSPSTEMDSSPASAKRTTSPRERVSRSSSLTSRDGSSRRGWSKSERDKQSSSSLSSRDSQSYSRSRSRTGSRSRSYSKRSSRSRIAYKSSRSRSRSKSRSRSSSASKHPKAESTSPKNATAPLNEGKPANVEPVRAPLPQNDQVVLQPVAAESAPVIPLSDSPPPSRWKPGQKPWKPSYERIQEMKAKTTQVIHTQTPYVVETVQTSSSTAACNKRGKSSDSDRSNSSKNQSDKSSRSWRRSRSRTSPSRSYSKSYSRSRSPSSSRSRSTVRSHSVNKSPSDQSCYSGSSSYFSLSEDERQKAKMKSDYREKLPKKRQSSSESTLPYVKDTASQRPGGSASRSSSVFSTDSEQLTEPQPVQAKGQVRPEKHHQKPKKSASSFEGQDEKPPSERGSDRSRKRTLREKSESPQSGRKAKKKTRADSKWDSESNSERGVDRNHQEESRLSSSKEEGEATSDSETDPGLVKWKAALEPPSGVLKAEKPASLSETESARSHSGARGTSRKRKHGSKKNAQKKVHSKKAKEKSKGKKEKKHKAPKQKETFHWQPPLEFGEEEDEEEVLAVKPRAKDKSKKQIALDVQDKNQDRKVENDRTGKDKTRDGEKLSKQKAVPDEAAGPVSPANQARSRQDDGPSSSTDKNAGPSGSVGAAKAKKDNEGEVAQMDDMEICTPDHSSPVKVGAGLSPLCVKVNLQDIKTNKNPKAPRNSETERAKRSSDVKACTEPQETNRRREREGSQPPTAAASAAAEGALKQDTPGQAQGVIVDHKWKPLQGVGHLQVAAAAAGPSTSAEAKTPASSELKPQGLRIEIKSKNKIRPGSLFDEVRKTARLNRRPRNHESSSEEDSPTREESESRSHSRSRSKSEPKSRHRTRSLSYSRSRSHSRSSTYSYR